MRLFRASRFARQIPIFLPAAVRRCPASLDNEDFVVDGVTMRLTNRDRRWDDGVLFAAGDRQRVPVGVDGVHLTIRTFLIPPTCDNLPPSGRVGGRRAGVARAGPDTPTTPGSHASLTPSSPPLRLPPPKNRVTAEHPRSRPPRHPRHPRPVGVHGSAAIR